ncbi:hypothetical protein [Deinococcus soli (ex Cha et al. 2016)]|uniref:Uncharacterized protein n=1 Tax=Deinococcus soli (ex Cha et al. 2016) TaxID=1309411 RepID=A0ACC6KNN0_9DEIO|nr:hypothetical protein [Deinococcus soli (ex Cha et al. 2016)]MDR6330648.1 hypothetical protein [Deinococcus soli (ex Cha et al. 2016)]MDR6754015.1 hypothetical protein [Deinococcus soli (ex Cha et al. 2016)]
MFDILKSKKFPLFACTLTLDELRIMSLLLPTTVKVWQTDARFTVAFDTEADQRTAAIILEALRLKDAQEGKR